MTIFRILLVGVEINCMKQINVDGFVLELIDQVLQEDDIDNDGYLSYAEYAASRRKNINEQQPAVKIVP